MKYSYIIAVKKTAFLLIFFLSISQLSAQLTTASAYSRYGIGLFNKAAFNGNFALGKASYAWRPYNYRPKVYDSLARSGATINDRNSNYINPGNPASFSNFSLTTYEVGLLSHNVNYTAGGQTEQNSFTHFGHLAIAFPIGSHWGLGFGIRPASNIGYNYQTSQNINGDLATFSYDGSGGLNEIFLSTAVELADRLSLGVSGKFLFGNKFDNRRIVYDESTFFFNTLDEKQIQYTDLALDFGLQYAYQFNTKYRAVLGLVASPKSEISGELTQKIRNYNGAENFEQFRDTVLFIDEADVTEQLAPNYGVGLSFEKIGKWMILADYTMRNWNDYEVEPEIILTNSMLINLGYERFTKQTSFGSFFKKMGYRAGAYYNSSVVNISGTDVQEFGISFGLAVPLRKTFSTLNLGVEVGQRGEEENNLVKEQFINIQFGVTINDRWFLQRKYD